MTRYVHGRKSVYRPISLTTNHYALPPLPMLPLFLGLTLVNLACLGVAGWLGYAAARGNADARAMHTLVGALAALVCVGVHCVVFTYFIATAKWVRHAIAVKRLDPALAGPTRSFKVQAFPAALLAMAATFAAAILGAARDTGMIARGPHHLLAIAAAAANIVVAFVEYRAIARNGRLIDDLLARIEAQQPTTTTTTARAEADVV